MDQLGQHLRGGAGKTSPAPYSQVGRTWSSPEQPGGGGGSRNERGGRQGCQQDGRGPGLLVVALPIFRDVSHALDAWGEWVSGTPVRRPLQVDVGGIDHMCADWT